MKTTTEGRRITLATLKSFARKNHENLLLKVRSRFNSSIDGSETLTGGFEPIRDAAPHYSNIGDYFAHTLGILGVWIVDAGRNYCAPYEDENYKGIEVYNCCANFVLAVKK